MLQHLCFLNVLKAILTKNCQIVGQTAFAQKNFLAANLMSYKNLQFIFSKTHF